MASAEPGREREPREGVRVRHQDRHQSVIRHSQPHLDLRARSQTDSMRTRLFHGSKSTHTQPQRAHIFYKLTTTHHIFYNATFKRVSSPSSPTLYDRSSRAHPAPSCSIPRHAVPPPWALERAPPRLAPPSPTPPYRGRPQPAHFRSAPTRSTRSHLAPSRLLRRMGCYNIGDSDNSNGNGNALSKGQGVVGRVGLGWGG